MDDNRLQSALTEMDNLPPLGSLWRHYKGSLVRVVAHGLDSERLVPLVGYRHQDASGQLHAPTWVHDLGAWGARVKLELGLDTPRFVRVRENDPG
jgi:hypothetical protein